MSFIFWDGEAYREELVPLVQQVRFFCREHAALVEVISHQRVAEPWGKKRALSCPVEGINETVERARLTTREETFTSYNIFAYITSCKTWGQSFVCIFYTG